MDRQLEIKTKIRFKDAFRYNTYVAYRSTMTRIFVGLSILSMGVFVYNVINGAGRIDENFAQSFSLLIPPFILCVLIPTRVWRATKALLDSQILKDEVTYLFDQEKITLRTSQGEADIQWDSYVRIAETRHDFRFFMDQVQAQIIPKYSLTQEEIQKLKTIIKASADSKVVKLRSF